MIDSAEKLTPIWADRIPVWDSAQNNKTLWSTITNLATAIFWLKTTTNLTEWANLYYLTSRFTTDLLASDATLNTDADISSNTWVLDEDNMVSNSNTKVPTQQSVKAYADTLWAITWEVKLWTTVTAPTSWLLCDWVAVSRTTYADLFAVIWTTYWVWDWSTTFNVPDLKGNVPVGKDSGTFSALWGTGWAETHTLTESEIPAHTHTLTWWGNNSGPANWARHVDDSTGNITTNSTWWGGSHNNLQPYLVMNYIIKT